MQQYPRLCNKLRRKTNNCLAFFARKFYLHFSGDYFTVALLVTYGATALKFDKSDLGIFGQHHLFYNWQKDVETDSG